MEKALEKKLKQLNSKKEKLIEEEENYLEKINLELKDIEE